MTRLPAKDAAVPAGISGVRSGVVRLRMAPSTRGTNGAGTALLRTRPGGDRT